MAPKRTKETRHIVVVADEDQIMDEIKTVADVSKEAQRSGPDAGCKRAPQTEGKKQHSCEEDVPWDRLQGVADDVHAMQDAEGVADREDDKSCHAEAESEPYSVA